METHSTGQPELGDVSYVMTLNTGKKYRIKNINGTIIRPLRMAEQHSSGQKMTNLICSFFKTLKAKTYLLSLKCLFNLRFNFINVEVQD